MRRWFKVFPELLLVDAPRNMYKLFSFMVHDVYGHEQYVQHSLMENERSECLTHAIDSFKFSNPSWEKILEVVIDKDSIETHFPNVKAILCHFHLKKYIRTEMSKGEYDGPSSFD
ncbi:Hypothetical protein PHPALM_36661 [Phytophthora palmivora]|uniref:ZSWIM1/3 RNaseH-like domain-containing protein n=1 Tax=Phytophthora palmivora TaxID=4796 RepID=A0A2P4WZE4_9STRA|nr:Hypothetical protein PHPALM_36661 [Phytophthora palmivora]